MIQACKSELIGQILRLRSEPALSFSKGRRPWLKGLIVGYETLSRKSLQTFGTGPASSRSLRSSSI